MDKVKDCIRCNTTQEVGNSKTYSQFSQESSVQMSGRSSSERSSGDGEESLYATIR